MSLNRRAINLTNSKSIINLPRFCPSSRLSRNISLRQQSARSRLSSFQTRRRHITIHHDNNKIFQGQFKSRSLSTFSRKMAVSSSQETLPSPPFVDIPGIANFRDIGGYATSNGQHIRRGLVFRSADPTRATEDGLKKMGAEIGLKEIFDLRSLPEIQRDGPEWGGVEAHSADVFEPYGMHRDWVPVFAAQDYGPEQVALRYKEYTRSGTEGFVQAYRDIMKAGTGAYGKILRHLAQAQPTPCLVHCTAGKDRTGVLVALLFRLTGVEKEQIASEYALTDQGLAHLKPLFIERLLKNPALDGNRAGVLNMVSSKRENMLATLEMIDGEFGGPESYMRIYCGLSDEEIQRIRTNLVGGGGGGSETVA